MKKPNTWAGWLLALLFAATPAGGFDVHLRLSTGLGRLNPFEVNAAVTGWAEQFKRVAEFYPAWSFVSQDIHALKQDVVFEGELLFSFSRRFALGLSGGYSYASVQEKDALLTVISDGVTNNWTKPSKVSACPIIASGYLFFPLGSKFNVYLRAGAGFMYAKYVDREGLKEISAAQFSYPVFETASARKPAYLGGLGFSYNFDSPFGFFVEATFQSGKVDGFSGVDTQNNAGRLYFYEEYFSYLDYWQTKMRVLPAAPSGPNFRSVREAAFDLGGYSARVGLSLRF
jgi:hypothetical protein